MASEMHIQLLWFYGLQYLEEIIDGITSLILDSLQQRHQLRTSFKRSFYSSGGSWSKVRLCRGQPFFMVSLELPPVKEQRQKSDTELKIKYYKVIILCTCYLLRAQTKISKFAVKNSL